jgi:predicted lysophospholipase L1 biosynthesis ABC-type transport system permease subunit
MEIVGVVGDTRMESPDAEAVPALYRPLAQKPWNWLSWGTVVARVAPNSDPKLLRPHFQSALWQLDDQVAVNRFDTVADRYAESMARSSFAMALMLGFALLALTLSIVGLYGLMAFDVAQQRQSIGVRLALGARAGHVVRDIVVRSIRLAGAGLVIGVAAALLTTRLLASLLYGVQPNDPITFTTIGAVILITAVLAAWLPAARAVRTSPLVALQAS